MIAQDVYRFINDLDDATIQGLIERLEVRSTDPNFAKMRDAYLAETRLSPSAQILELGCGTGVVARAIAKREDFSGRITGVDQSPALIEAARRLATEEGVDQRIEFRVGDVHSLDFAEASFHAVIAHTLLSHVADPLTVLKEAARVIQPEGLVVIFDGDYASLTFAYSDPVLAKAMDEAIMAIIVNNQRVMRDLPRLLRQAGLELAETMADVYAEIGTSSFFSGAAETYAPLVARAELLPAVQVETWLAEQREALQQGTFFAACNYSAYITRRVAA
jgi:ubiquinone/menaquinone biosynthesis C-methylase UbiE